MVAPGIAAPARIYFLAFFSSLVHDLLLCVFIVVVVCDVELFVVFIASDFRSVFITLTALFFLFSIVARPSFPQMARRDGFLSFFLR